MRRSFGPMMRVGAAITCAVFTSACTVHSPLRFMAPSEVFPPDRLMDRPSGAAEDRIEAPYADVFRAAMMAAIQAALVVEVADESRGVILASRSSQEEWHGRSHPTMHYYAIAVAEKGAA